MRRTIIDTTNLELTDKVVSIKRVTKVVKGGRNMRFTALVVVGDGNGHVGVGLGKSIEIPEAIRKGKEDAAKHLVSVALDENNSVTHDFLGKYGSSTVLLKKAPEGTGVIAGGPARSVLELAGYKNIRTKSLGSNNKTNVVLATIEGLLSLKTPEEVAKLRGKSVEEILKETLIHREKGSGTLAILEEKLLEHNESLERFHRHICISSFKMIIDLIKSGYGISFVYEVLAQSDPELGIFTLKGEPIVREFNVIYLKHADVREKMEWFL